MATLSAPANLKLHPVSLMKMDRLYERHFPNDSLSKGDRLYDGRLPVVGGDCWAEAESGFEGIAPMLTPSRQMIKVQRTFINVDIDETAPACLLRSSSAPALLCQFSEDESSNKDILEVDDTLDESRQDSLSMESDDLSTADSTDDSTDDSTAASTRKGSKTAFDASLTGGEFSWSMQEMHRLGQCRPCGYFAFKADGCRKGGDCTRCHICTSDEVMTRVKEIKKAKKNMRKIRQNEEYHMKPKGTLAAALPQRRTTQPGGGHFQGQEPRRTQATPPGYWSEPPPARTYAAPARMGTAPFTSTPPPPMMRTATRTTTAPGDYVSLLAGRPPAGPLSPTASRDWTMPPAPVRGSGSAFTADRHFWTN